MLQNIWLGLKIGPWDTKTSSARRLRLERHRIVSSHDGPPKQSFQGGPNESHYPVRLVFWFRVEASHRLAPGFIDLSCWP